jgi:cytochrome-b5 reductase
LQLRAEWNGKEVVRSYTPITLDDVPGHFELLIKAYPQGNASRYMDALKVGDRAPFRGPKGRFLYRQNMAKAVGMIAGGTGLTPILQVIKAILRDPQDTTKVSLIFANVTEDDILLHQELLELAKKHPSQFRVYFVLNEVPMRMRMHSYSP